MHTLLRSTALAATLGLALSVSPALGEILEVKATLTGAEEVPPNDSAGTGILTASYDEETKVLSWVVSYEGVVATAAHFHGPAAPGENAPPVIPIVADLASPIEGTATLTDEQVQQLKEGMWYLNVHSAEYPDGEVRGQVLLADQD